MLPEIDPQEYITVKSYEEICDFRFDTHNLTEIPRSGSVVHCHLDNIGIFLRNLVDNPDCEDIVLVSSGSDFGLAKQADHPVYADMRKWISTIDWATLEDQERGYLGLQLPPRCEVRNCRLTDEYSVKCWSFTQGTFSVIPPSIKKWFITNLMFDPDEGNTLWEGIPFGIAEKSSHDVHSVASLRLVKEAKLYVNFQNYTSDRFFIKQYFASRGLPWVNVVLDASLPRDRYLRDIASHQFVLCPNGNGIDCYRTWECLYVGSTPVLENTPTTRQFKDLPVILLDSVERLSLDYLLEKQAEIDSKAWNRDLLTLSYWKDRIYGALQ